MKKKCYPRISTQLPAVVANEEGIRLKVTATVISADDFSFQCSTSQRDSITPGGCFIPRGRPVELDVLLELPFADHNLPIMISGQVVFSRRIAHEKCEIGIRYNDFAGEAYTGLIKFIETRLTALSKTKLVSPSLIDPAQAFV